MSNNRNPFPFLNKIATENCPNCKVATLGERKVSFSPRHHTRNVLSHRRAPARPFFPPKHGPLIVDSVITGHRI